MANRSGALEPVRSIDSIGKANRTAKALPWKPSLLKGDYAQRTGKERRNARRPERESSYIAIDKYDHSHEYGNAHDIEANALR